MTSLARGGTLLLALQTSWTAPTGKTENRKRANYYWMDIHGNILGTDSYKAASVDSHERLRQP